jgi:hypothetical protein
MRNAVERMTPRPAVGRAAPGWALAPMLSGARARGFADGLEWLRLAAALIDDRGEALHLNAGAIEILGYELHLESGRLRSADPELDASIGEAIRETLTTGATSELSIASGRPLTLRIVAVEPAADDPGQLMRAVVVFERAGRA